MDKITELLREYGLKAKEIKIYLFLVGKIKLTAYKIAKETKIHRSTTYDILDRLIIKGFVNKSEKDNRFLFSANELSKVISSLKDKESILESLMPQIEKLVTYSEPSVRIFEGIDGQKQFNYNLFRLAKDKSIKFCYIIGNTYASSLSSKIFITKLIKEFKKTKLKLDYKGIWNSKFKDEKIIKDFNKLGKNKFLDVLSKVGTIIYDNHIAYLFTQDKPYIIEIKNELISKEMKDYFMKLWKISF